MRKKRGRNMEKHEKEEKGKDGGKGEEEKDMEEQ